MKNEVINYLVKWIGAFLFMLFIVETLPMLFPIQCFAQETLQTVTNNGAATTNNIGVGTPVVLPWTTNQYHAIQIGSSGVMGSDYGYSYLTSNAYYDGATWRIASTSGIIPSYIQIVNGTISYFVGTAGTQGSAFTGTNVFSLDYLGNITANSLSIRQGLTGTTAKYLSGSSILPALIIGGAGGPGTTNQGVLQFGDANTNFLIEGGSDYVGLNFIAGGNTVLHLNSNAKATFSSSVMASSFITAGGTSSEFLKADGSMDNTTYLPTSGGAITGNLGIGTSNPQSKLAVNGTITATEVKVTQTGWSDFVFDSTYHLPSLSKTETFIKKNHHLPDIPSAKEIETNGLDLGSMEQKQMQKIEELTLYLIKTEKEIKEIKSENKELKKALENLKTKVEGIKSQQ